MDTTTTKIYDGGKCNDWIVFLQNVTAILSPTIPPIFQNISFTIPRYCIFGVFGATGCGKSTLAQGLAGFIEPSCFRGTLRISWKSPALTTKWEEKIVWENIRGKHVVYVPQDTYKNLNPYETVGQQLQRLLLQYERLDTLHEIVDMVELDTNLLEHMPQYLSAGQRQRVSLACAFAASPELLILDEPMSAMDHKGRVHLITTLQKFSQKHTVLLISHENPQYHSMIPKENRFYFPTPDTNTTTPRLPTVAMSQVQIAGIISRQTAPIADMISRQTTPRLPTQEIPQMSLEDAIPTETFHAEKKISSVPFPKKTFPTPTSQKYPLLHLQNLTQVWDGFMIFHHLDFAIQRGEWIYLQGYNGCGKSTLLHILLGLVIPTEGVFMWQNEHIPWRDVQQHSRKYVHTVFQDVYTSFSPHRTILQNLEESMERISIHNRWILEEYWKNLWEELELPHPLQNLYPHQLSYGQQKRSAIVRCLLDCKRAQLLYGQEHLLLLDESLSGIHRELRQKIIELLREIDTSHISILWVAHEDIALKDICDRVWEISYTLP